MKLLLKLVKLLVKEILFNTDDRTGLISKCEKGGKIIMAIIVNYLII